MPKIRPPATRVRSTPISLRSDLLGNLETIKECEDALRLQAKILHAQGNVIGSARCIISIMSAKFKTRELELKGLNMERDEGQSVKFTVVDYLPRYEASEAERKKLLEEVAALREAVALNGGPKPPRPPDRTLN